MALHKKEVNFSLQAAEDLERVYAYLLEEWGDKVLEKFVAELNDFLFIISHHPRMFSYLNKTQNLRKHTLYKHNLIVYKNGRRSIDIVAVLNAHENPSAIKKKLRQRLT